MAEVRRLRFRRHLLVCVLLALLNELRHDFWAQQGRAHQLDHHQPAGRGTQRYTRTRLASAYEIRAGQTGAIRPALVTTSAGTSVYQHNTNDDLSTLARFLAIIHNAMPVINLNYSILSPSGRFEATSNLDELIDDYYDEKFPENMSLDELQLMSVRAAVRTAPTPLHISWGYQSRELSRLGSAPVLDDDLCSLQLNHLAKRLEQALKQPAPPAQATSATAGTTHELERADPALAGIASPVDNFEARQVYRSGDLEIMRYLDTYGRVPSDLFRGNVRWYGSYMSCMRTRLRAYQPNQHEPNNDNHEQQQHQQTDQTIKFRYCMGAYRSHGWLNSMTTSIQDERLRSSSLNRTKWLDYGIGSADMNLNHYFIRIGLCLPEACDSSALERPDNARSMERLLKFNLAKPFNSDHYQLTDLYCPPDSRSPLRRIPVAGKLLLAAGCLWLALIVGATIVHLNVEKFYLKTVELIRREQQQQQREERRSSSISNQHHEEAGAEEAEEEEETVIGKNELGESDILNMKLNVIKLNIYIRDKSRQLIPGVDLVDCLSLYSNWLRYTKRVKLAVVHLHERELALERRRLRNERIVVKRHAASRENDTSLATLTMAAPVDRFNAKTTLGPSQTLLTELNSNNTNKAEPILERMRRRLGAGGGHLPSSEPSANQQPSQTTSTTTTPAGTNRPTRARPEVRVDTSSLNALKVIALVWIIAGHCIFYLGSAIANGALLKDIMPTLTAFALANGALYITELFFIITGCLTAYLTFKHTTKLTDECDHQTTGLELRERSSSGSSSSSVVVAPTTMRLDSGSRAANNESGDGSHPVQMEQQHEHKQHKPMVVIMERRLFGPPFQLLIVLNRYLRILPTYLFVYAFVKLVSVYVGGEGQLWDHAVSENSVRRACVQESWWPVLTLTTNFVDIYKHCIVGGWYLSADMQFAFISVPLLLLLAHCQRSQRAPVGAGPVQSQASAAKLTSPVASLAVSPTSLPPSNNHNNNATARQEVVFVARAQRRLFLAYGLIVALGCLSALLSIVQTILTSRVDLSYIVKFSPHTMAMLSQNIMLYTNSIFRFRAFAGGLILGHLLYCYEFQLIKLPKFIQQHGAKLTVVIFALGFSLMFMPVFLYRKIILSHDMTALLMVLSAGGIDIFLGSLIFLVCIGKAPKAILFALNSPLWSLLSSLSLSAFLIHTEIIIVLTSQLDPPPSIGYSLLLFIFSATLLLTYSMAFILYLTFEMPFSRLVDSAMRACLCINRNQRQETNN